MLAVGQASTARAQSAYQTSGALGALMAFNSWEGSASQAAAQATLTRRTALDDHGADAARIATAARTAANEVVHIKQQLAIVRANAARWGITIDPVSGRALPPANLNALPLPYRMLMPAALNSTQVSVDLVREAAGRTDDLLTGSIIGKEVRTAAKDTDPVKEFFGDVWEEIKKDGKWSAWEDEWSGKHEFDNGIVAEGSIGAEALSVGADADWDLSSDGLSAGANAGLTVVGGEMGGTVEWGPAALGGNARAALEATADVNANIGKNGLDIGAEAFAGGKVTLDGSADIAGVGVEGGVEGWAGAGFAADANFTVEDGKLKIGGELGAAWGLGGKYSGGVEIDPDKVVDSVKNGVKSFFGF
ncbi:hypothetical protein [Mycobacterium hubeiense]|uniref:hypothetical protein n=1 Tax=Mycobacterium hubeiense TaxID=1867256 RepID=UPI001158FB3C|nr:hypothetical protein [Mycobacterium sp. QGD 101]